MNSNNLTLLTDLYQLTMACGYWKSGIAEQRACFHLFYRRAPFGGTYAIAGGLQTALDYLKQLDFSEDTLDYLRALETPGGAPLFPETFLEMLASASCNVDVWAMPEGTVVLPHQPMLRVEGPLWQVQLVETALLNIAGFQTLIATKAARICDVARDPQGVRENVIEFGLRRAQGVDGALAASRAAYLGGCNATSNVLAGQRYGIPIRGTHAHAWVMAFGNDEEAFTRYAEAFPDTSVFLVDTFDTVEGVKTAIRVGQKMRLDGHELKGIRLDSGDLAALSIRARALLDEAEFTDVKVVASNDLDEHRIASLKDAGARIDVWGVGTRLSTAYDQPALGGVYKLGAMVEDGTWSPRMKMSNTPIKRSIPGRLQVRRYADLDVIVDIDASLGGTLVAREPESGEERTTTGEFVELLQPVMRDGKQVGPKTSLKDARGRAITGVENLPKSCRRLERPEARFGGIEVALATRRADGLNPPNPGSPNGASS